jgi:hypothetical protein
LLDTLLEVEGLARVHSSHYPGFPFWMLTLTFGVAQLRSALEWSEAALAMLSSTEVGIDPKTASPQPPANTADKP